MTSGRSGISETRLPYINWMFISMVEVDKGPGTPSSHTAELLHEVRRLRDRTLS